MKEDEKLCLGKGKAKDKVLVEHFPLVSQERDKKPSAEKSQSAGKNPCQKKNSVLISFKQSATTNNHTCLTNTATCVSLAYGVTPEEFDEEAVEMTKAAEEAYQRAKELNRNGVIDAWHAVEKTVQLNLERKAAEGYIVSMP